jgi:hypothetical protein
MSQILATFPGRYGDIAWALPSVRALAETYETRIDFCISGEFASFVPLLKRAAPYLDNVWAEPCWTLMPPNEWHSTINESVYGRVLEIGYRGWPDQPLPQYTYEQTTRLVQAMDPQLTLAPLDLERPWMSLDSPDPILDDPAVAVGFSEAHFELKFGMLKLLYRARAPKRSGSYATVFPNGRWVKEGGFLPTNWEVAASRIAQSAVFLGCCSAPHVLARAMGKPVILYEPMSARLNPIFLPFGTTGNGVELVRGLDGEMTTDSRHVRETLERVLEETRRSEKSLT